MSLTALQTIWYVLIGVLLTGYAILDGFDLGAGVLLPFVAREDRERRLVFHAIGPFWDGNEVWLLTGAGALFAAFPPVYATVFSGFYLAMMLVLFALIVRAVSFEFRSKVEEPRWRRAWDWTFFVSSLLPALLLGVAMGNVVRGVPLTAEREYAGGLLPLLNPFSLLVGAAGLAMFVTHGAIYLLTKTDGPVAERARRAAVAGWTALIVLAVLSAVGVALDAPERLANFRRTPLAWVVPALLVAFLVLTRLDLARGKNGRAFLFSSLTIAGLMGMVGAGNFPYLLPARNVPEYGLSIYNASASQNTLTAMLVIALIGMPLVIAYTAYVYYVFRGQVRATEEGY
ncbi:MAG TPA: cytochrome d ubiquinol oxidase subunit II [Chloroflexi bacterium]|nr:cytochrome d ubiquinol oxidase subunit II [Chloroflexota bacterium]